MKLMRSTDNGKETALDESQNDVLNTVAMWILIFRMLEILQYRILRKTFFFNFEKE